MLRGMSVQIAVRLADDELERLDAAIARGAFSSRAEAVRAGLVAVLREEREARIGAAYRRAYATEADDPSVGEAGLQLGAALLAAEDDAARAGPDS
jgi:Arc/MetJ-type ribon-helix-helix transcriptional regulator